MCHQAEVLVVRLQVPATLEPVSPTVRTQPC
jgi:hypothetical protein